MRLLLMNYAGAAAEELILGQMSYGSILGTNADFYNALEYIKAYIVMTDGSVSKSMLETEMAEKIIDCAHMFYGETMEILLEHKKEVEVIATALKGRDELTGEEIETLIAKIEE